MFKKCKNCRSTNAGWKAVTDKKTHIIAEKKVTVTAVRWQCNQCHCVVGNSICEEFAKKIAAKSLCLSKWNVSKEALQFCFTQAEIQQKNAEEIFGRDLVTKIPLGKILNDGLKKEEIAKLPERFWRAIAQQITKKTAHITHRVQIENA